MPRYTGSAQSGWIPYSKKFSNIFFSNLGEDYSLPWPLPIKSNEKIFWTEEEGLGWANNYIFSHQKKKKKRNGTQYNVNKWETNSFINSSRIPIWFINNEIYFNLHVDKINFMIEE